MDALIRARTPLAPEGFAAVQALGVCARCCLRLAAVSDVTLYAYETRFSPVASCSFD